MQCAIAVLQFQGQTSLHDKLCMLCCIISIVAAKSRKAHWYVLILNRTECPSDLRPQQYPGRRLGIQGSPGLAQGVSLARQAGAYTYYARGRSHACMRRDSCCASWQIAGPTHQARCIGGGREKTAGATLCIYLFSYQSKYRAFCIR